MSFVTGFTFLTYFAISLATRNNLSNTFRWRLKSLHFQPTAMAMFGAPTSNAPVLFGGPVRTQPALSPASSPNIDVKLLKDQIIGKCATGIVYVW